MADLFDIREALTEEHSSRQTAKIVYHIGADERRFKELMRLFLGDEPRMAQRASRAVSNCVEHHPKLIRPYFIRIIEQLECNDTHAALRRNSVRLLQFVDIPKRHEGRIFDSCYSLLDDSRQPVAVRAFALTVAAKIAGGSPELMDELRLVALKYPQGMTPGFRARLRSVLGVS